jgi:hypothetical protein
MAMQENDLVLSSLQVMEHIQLPPLLFIEYLSRNYRYSVEFFSVTMAVIVVTFCSPQVILSVI